MKVKLVMQHNLKAEGFFQAHGGKVFDVIWAREGGYDVDLAPMGHPGEWGFMHSDEVEVVDEAPTILERIANVQHAIWSHWMTYMFSVCISNPDGSYTIPEEKVERWKRQMETQYPELLERERDSDIEQAHKVLGELRK